MSVDFGELQISAAPQFMMGAMEGFEVLPEDYFSILVLFLFIYA